MDRQPHRFHRLRLRLRRSAIALVVLCVVSCSAAIFSARWFWLGELAASFEWQLGWCVFAAAGVLLLLGARRLALVAAVLAVVHVAPESWLSVESAPHLSAGEASPGVLRVVSANLLQPNRHYSEIAAALKRTDADVICVVELSGPMREVLERELSAWPHRVIANPTKRPYDGKAWTTGIFSKLPLGTPCFAPVTDSYAPLIEVHPECGVDGVVLRLVHLPRPGREWRVLARNEALSKIATEVEWTSRSIALGDFNTTSHSPAFGELLEATGLRDSRAGFGRQPSWWLRDLGFPLGIAIDHVLVGDAVEVRNRRTFALPFSDHGGVVVDLALR